MRTSSFWDEPRFVRPWLSSIDLQLTGGSTRDARSSSGKRTHLASLYGFEDVSALSAASPDFPLTLKGAPEHICLQAVADMFEVDLNIYQNFCWGFFLHFHLPAIVLRIYPTGFLEDARCHFRSRKNHRSIYEKPLDPLAPFLRHHDISINRIDQPGLSDSTLFLGWSYSYEDTCYLDFIDMTFKTGILFPTGKKKNVRLLFDIPYGYNGHWGIPVSGQITFGAYDWLSWGLYAEALFFKDKKRCLRMKTEHEVDCGFIVLGQGDAFVQQGTLWKAASYIKADHFFNGLSILLGISYEQKNRDHITPCNIELFKSSLVNNDPHFFKWQRSIFHFQADYDFAHENSVVGTRLAIFYNHEIWGTRVLSINTTGGYLGIDLSWCF